MQDPISKEDFEKEFLAFQHQLTSYLLRLSGNQQDAEDITQNTYIKATNHLHNFMGRSSLKTWVFTIATNLVRDHHRAKQRWTVNCQENARYDAYAHPERIDAMRSISQQSTAGAFELKEHIDFCFTCMSKTLSIEQQVTVILKDVYDFTMTEIMEITALSEGVVKHAIADGRKILIRIFDNKCALVSKKGICHQCSELNTIFNPKQNAQAEVQKLKMYKEFSRGATKDELYQLRTKLVRAIDPLQGVGTDLHSYFLALMPAYCDKIPNDESS